jgi:hypothetical protein
VLYRCLFWCCLAGAAGLVGWAVHLANLPEPPYLEFAFTFDASERDVGAVALDVPVEVVYDIMNTSDQPLRIYALAES